MLQVVIYAPDRHILYDAHTPDRKGVGGGITARIRLAHALAGLGHQVRVVGNVPRSHSVHGVFYQPLDKVNEINCDVIVLTSSGGALDLAPILQIPVRSRLRQVWVHGNARLKGLEQVGYDQMVVVSNYVRREVCREWGVPAGKVCVVYNGVNPARAHPFFHAGIQRDPFRLIYSGHPSKGLEAALGVIRLLRKSQPRFELHVYGGNRLWGEKESGLKHEAGVFYHGLVGQQRLADAFKTSNYSIHLQAIPEGFGLGLVEAMTAGCIVLASPVGAIPELVRPGVNGFLFPGDHLSGTTWQAVAELILQQAQAPAALDGMRTNAMATPLDWQTVARAWTGQWEWALGRSEGIFSGQACPECDGPRLSLADGEHCTSCGNFTMRSSLEAPHAF
jgi:glycosyltransferase involved in cell wall biosynthesis